MMKKMILGVLSVAMITSAVGCSNVELKGSKGESDLQVEEVETFEGEWATDLTRDEALALYNEILPRMEEALRFYGLNTLETYVTADEVSDEKGLVTNDRYIEVIIPEPDFNRLEGFYFGFKQYGSDLASGEIELMITSILDKDILIEQGFYAFEETSFSRFSQEFMGESERDYTELNKQIFDMIVANEEVATVENNLNGVKETVSITGNILLYKLETKEFEFIEEN